MTLSRRHGTAAAVTTAAGLVMSSTCASSSPGPAEAPENADAAPTSPDHATPSGLRTRGATAPIKVCTSIPGGRLAVVPGSAEPVKSGERSRVKRGVEAGRHQTWGWRPVAAVPSLPTPWGGPAGVAPREQGNENRTVTGVASAGARPSTPMVPCCSTLPSVCSPPVRRRARSSTVVQSSRPTRGNSGRGRRGRAVDLRPDRRPPVPARARRTARQPPPCRRPDDQGRPVTVSAGAMPARVASLLAHPLPQKSFLRGISTGAIKG
jgi:hypothetical protein